MVNEFKPEDDISLISDNNNTILERNESLEISIALSDSKINNNYMWMLYL